MLLRNMAHSTVRAWRSTDATAGCNWNCVRRFRYTESCIPLLTTSILSLSFFLGFVLLCYFSSFFWVRDAQVCHLLAHPPKHPILRILTGKEAFNHFMAYSFDFSAVRSSFARCIIIRLMSRVEGYAPVLEYCGGTELAGGYMNGTMLQPQVRSFVRV